MELRLFSLPGRAGGADQREPSNTGVSRSERGRWRLVSPQRVPGHSFTD